MGSSDHLLGGQSPGWSHAILLPPSAAAAPTARQQPEVSWPLVWSSCKKGRGTMRSCAQKQTIPAAGERCLNVSHKTQQGPGPRSGVEIWCPSVNNSLFTVTHLCASFTLRKNQEFGSIILHRTSGSVSMHKSRPQGRLWILLPLSRARL